LWITGGEEGDVERIQIKGEEGEGLGRIERIGEGEEEGMVRRGESYKRCFWLAMTAEGGRRETYISFD